jgi:hypothetical protein
MSARLGYSDCQLGFIQLAALVDSDEPNRVGGDNGHGTETASLNAVIYVNDYGFGLDSFVAPCDTTETGVGVDTAVVGAIAQEFGTGQYVAFPCCQPIFGPQLSAMILGIETGVVDELGGMETSGAIADESASGIDIGTPAADLASDDTAAATETTIYGPQFDESSTGIDSADLAAGNSFAESAAGVDAAICGPLATDAGSVAESFRSTATAASSDTGAGTDSPVLSLPIEDSGQGSEATAVINGPDFGTIGRGSDSAVLTADNAVSEAGSTTELIGVHVMIFASDGGQGSTSAGGIIAVIEADESGTANEFCWGNQ